MGICGQQRICFSYFIQQNEMKVIIPAVEFGLHIKGLDLPIYMTLIITILWARILVQVTIYRRLLIGRDGHLHQSKAYDIS